MEHCKACNRDFPNLMALSVHIAKQPKYDKKHKRLVPTKRDREIVRKRVQGKTLRQIAKEVGTSDANVFFTLKRCEPELKEALRDAGYGLSTAVAKMAEMTEAKRTVLIQNAGIVMEERKVEDNPIRFAARKEMLRIHGVGNTLDVQHSGTVTHEMTERERAEAIDVLEVIKQFAVDAEE